jgi:HSP20 family protein
MAVVVTEWSGHDTPSGHEIRAVADAWAAMMGRPLPAGTFVWPATDVYENKDEFIVRLEVAGLNENRLSLAFVEGRLIISGSRSGCCSLPRSSVLQMEIPYGQFRRVIKLPGGIRLNKAKAQYENGFLEMRIPKAQKPEKRKILVTVRW